MEFGRGGAPDHGPRPPCPNTQAAAKHTSTTRTPPIPSCASTDTHGTLSDERGTEHRGSRDAGGRQGLAARRRQLSLQHLRSSLLLATTCHFSPGGEPSVLREPTGDSALSWHRRRRPEGRRDDELRALLSRSPRPHWSRGGSSSSWGAGIDAQMGDSGGDAKTPPFLFNN